MHYKLYQITNSRGQVLYTFHTREDAEDYLTSNPMYKITVLF